MGMFDSFMLKTKCPYCGLEEVREFQTKQFGCYLIVWNEGDEFDGADIKINDGIIKDVYGGCNSKECDDFQIKQDGYKSGFGRRFYCDVVIENGRVKQGINIKKEE